MKNIFYTIGYFSSRNPWIALIFTISVTTLFGLGMYNMRLETEPQNLWASPASRTYKEQQNFADNFGPFYRTNQFMLVNYDGSNRNIFDKEALGIIKNMKIESNRKNIELDDLCFKPVSGKGCLAPSPMDIWLQDPQLLRKDEDIQFTTLCTETIDIKRTNIPCSDTNGIPVIREAIFGGIKCGKHVPDDQPCDHCWIEATTLIVTYLLDNDKFTSQDAATWELEVYMKTVQKFNERDYQWLYQNYHATWPSPSKDTLDSYKIVYLSERSVPDELVTETNQNAWVVMLSYAMMFIYISLALGQMPSYIYSSFLLGFGGILIVAFSMIGSLGLVSYLNIGLTMISAEVIPFLILAIGVDNMFIIKHSYQRIENADSLEDKMGKALRSVGPSITTAAICETLAFIVGALTKMPALQSFCIQAAIGVFLDYLFQITAFIAFLTWDEKRQFRRKADCFFCLQFPEAPAPTNQQFVKKIIEEYYNPLLENWFCRAVTFIIFAGFMALSFVGAYKLENGLEAQVSMVSGGDLDNYFTYENKYIEIGPPAYLVLTGLDYQDKEDLLLVSELSNALSQLDETVQPPIYSWVAAFNLFIKTGAEWVEQCGTKDIALEDFPTQLNLFINTKITSNCCQRYGICGEQFQADIVLDHDGFVRTSRLRFQHRPIHDSAGYILTFEQTRQVIDKLTVNLPEGKSVYAYSLPYIFYDQYSYIRGIAIQNILLGLATIFLTVTVIQDAICALLVSVTVFIISFNLIGMVWLLNIMIEGFAIQINAISVVNLVTCLGLAVEFCAHIVIKFRKGIGSRQERIRYSMKTMGASVFIGIASTKFIGVIVLAFANSTLFKLYYFRMYILMVVVGTFNGLCVLPIFLCLLGPAASLQRSNTHTKVVSLSEDQLKSSHSSFNQFKSEK